MQSVTLKTDGIPTHWTLFAVHQQPLNAIRVKGMKAGKKLLLVSPHLLLTNRTISIRKRVVIRARDTSCSVKGIHYQRNAVYSIGL